MATFDVDREAIYVFPVGEEYLFSYYFERTDVFEALKEHYNGEKYRFEVPESEFDVVGSSSGTSTTNRSSPTTSNHPPVNFQPTVDAASCPLSSVPS